MYHSTSTALNSSQRICDVYHHRGPQFKKCANTPQATSQEWTTWSIVSPVQTEVVWQLSWKTAKWFKETRGCRPATWSERSQMKCIPVVTAPMNSNTRNEIGHVDLFINTMTSSLYISHPQQRFQQKTADYSVLHIWPEGKFRMLKSLCIRTGWHQVPTHIFLCCFPKHHTVVSCCYCELFVKLQWPKKNLFYIWQVPGAVINGVQLCNSRLFAVI